MIHSANTTWDFKSSPLPCGSRTCIPVWQYSEQTLTLLVLVLLFLTPPVQIDAKGLLPNQHDSILKSDLQIDK